MSLISTQNLVAPLTNTVHLITIILVAISFAILRLMGASLSVQPVSNMSTPRVQDSAPLQQEQRSAPSIEQELFKQDAADEPLWAQPEQDQVEDSPSPAGGGLDDIERALGM